MISATVLSAAIFAASSQELMHRSKSFGMGANLLERASGKRSLEQLRKSGTRYLSDLQRLRGLVVGCDDTLAKIEVVEGKLKSDDFRIKVAGEALARSIQLCAKQQK
jgi:hypothetical protein